MCIGIPVQVVETGECVALCQGRNGIEQVNLMLIGPQPAGTWLLSFLGSAREVISQQDALHIDLALDGLTAIMQGGANVDVDSYFPGLGASSGDSQ
ncbi:MAG: HypC/HybG/HupF family hydrogenase formation chaperone [bacterium]|nr:HypC/HybG/HupF family hydrogenase formation chaperone [bacterium]